MPFNKVGIGAGQQAVLSQEFIPIVSPLARVREFKEFFFPRLFSPLPCRKVYPVLLKLILFPFNSTVLLLNSGFYCIRKKKKKRKKGGVFVFPILFKFW